MEDNQTTFFFWPYGPKKLMDKNIYGNGEKYCTAVLITVFLCFDF